MYKLLTVLALLVLAPGAYANPIAAGSELSINGSDTFTNTQVNFVNPGNIGGTSGSFTELANCDNCVTMTTPITTATTGNLFTATSGADTANFVSAGGLAFTTGGTPALPSLTVSASGVMHLTGFDATPGLFELTTQGPESSAEVTFSATSIAVPEPGAIGVFAIGLLGLMMVKYRRA